uniref:Exocyst subunit Exo70 family protein n=1 Tax=Aegilops tauschii subsp. strangulata TaxID=200361 RepID=A0A453DCC2_AEGTS
ELDQGRPSIAGWRAAVPELRTNGSMAACPPRGLYRDRIRTVAVTGAQIRSTLSSHSQSGQSGSSCSGDSGDSVSYNNSGSPSHSPSAVATDFGAHGHELAMVARQMMEYMFTPVVISPEAQSIFSEIGGSLERQGDRLYEVLSSMMEEVRTPMEEDDTWAIEILRGGGGVHRNTRLMVDYITSMREACASTQNCAPSNNTVNLGDLIDDTIEYLEDLLLRKSELCSDPSLRYIFLLNNSHFVAQVSEPSVSLYLEQRSELNLTPECKKFMDSYLDVSWGHVLSCIPKSRFPGPIHCWINTSSLAKFESAFQKTYRAQKFWKVPDPRLRDVLRRAIAERVISGYGDYLEEHPELEKHIGRESSSPEVFKKMLGELFEG